MNKKSFFGATMLVALVASVLSFGSCKKEEKEEPTPTTVETQAKFDRIVRFLSIILGVEESRIVFDQQSQEFYIPNSEFRASFKEIEDFYDKSTEYKLNYEQ